METSDAAKKCIGKFNWWICRQSSTSYTEDGAQLDAGIEGDSLRTDTQSSGVRDLTIPKILEAENGPGVPV